MGIALIEKIEFDKMENHHAEYSENLGYVNTAYAQQIVEKLTSEDIENDKQYDGWDSKLYPRYVVKPISRLDYIAILGGEIEEDVEEDVEENS